MKFDKSMLLLYAVTDRTWTGRQNLYQQVEDAISGGATMIQLREKELSYTEFLDEALKIRQLTSLYKIPLIINDNIEIALACKADGLHVGQGDLEATEARRLLGPDRILGVTAKTPEQAIAAQTAGADYLGSGAVFGSATKKDAALMDTETLRSICSSVSIPVVAIGGIRQENIKKLAGIGIAGAAVVSGIFAAPDIKKAAETLRREINHIVSSKSAMLPNRFAPPPVLSIAGSDCSGGAGIQADLKTILAFQAYGMSVITVLTAQNTWKVDQILETPPEFVGRQLDCVFEDIPPMAVKIGMVYQEAVIMTVAERLRRYCAPNVVLDPVMVSSSGKALLEKRAMDTLTRELFPLAKLITPNIPETQLLTGLQLRTISDMEQAAELLGKRYGTSVLVKGGHRTEDACDVLYCQEEDRCIRFNDNRLASASFHGTGCTLSSAIACGLAWGKNLEESIRKAKTYIRQAMNPGLRLGKGSLPLNHGIFSISS